MEPKRPNRQCQKELQEYSVLGTSQTLTKAARSREGGYRLRICRNFRSEKGGIPEDTMEMFGRK